MNKEIKLLAVRGGLFLLLLVFVLTVLHVIFSYEHRSAEEKPPFPTNFETLIVGNSLPFYSINESLIPGSVRVMKVGIGYSEAEYIHRQISRSVNYSAMVLQLDPESLVVYDRKYDVTNFDRNGYVTAYSGFKQLFDAPPHNFFTFSKPIYIERGEYVVGRAIGVGRDVANPFVLTVPEHRKHSQAAVVGRDLGAGYVGADTPTFDRLLRLIQDNPDMDFVLVKYPLMQALLDAAENNGFNFTTYYSDINQSLSAFENVHILDYQNSYADDDFLDSQHITSTAQQHFSRQFADDLQRILNNN